MFEELSDFDFRPILLLGEILIAYFVLMAFALSGGIGPTAEFDEFFHYLLRIAYHVVMTVISMYSLGFLPKDTPAELSAFYFAESIGAVYIFAKVGVAAQIAILLKYNALFEPEPAWEKLKELEGPRLFAWFFAMGILLNPLFVEAPKELRAKALWDDIWLDAQNRSFDRERFSFVSKFNREAERFLPARIAAQNRRGHLKLAAAAAGTILVVIGVCCTEWLRRGEGT
jgi:hypothetical protein